MSDPDPHCPSCGGPLKQRGSRTVCPRCLLAGAVEEGSSEISTSDPPVKLDAPNAGALAGSFPDLEIRRLIGAGGMGLVYEAEQKALERVVALKLMRLESVNPEFTERFQREAKTLAKLSHPNIVSIYDQGERDGWVFILMEYVEGRDLSRLLDHGKLPPDQALAITEALCSALEYAHENGVVHRDIKPANILLTEDGGVKIADFGLAKLAGPEHQNFTLTTGGSSLGTPLYMAPEQRKSSADADARADIYSAGVVLYEMLTGELPVGRVRPPSELCEVPKSIDGAVMRAIENEPERRFQTVREFHDTLARCASPATGRRALLGVAACAVLASAAFALWPKDPDPADGQRTVYPPPVKLTGADAVLIRQNPQQRRAYFGTIIAAAGNTLAICAPNNNVLLPVSSASGEVYVCEIGPDGNPTHTAVLRAKEPKPRDLFGGNLDISPDGNTIAVAAPDWKSDAGDKGIVEIFVRREPGANEWDHLQTLNMPEGYSESTWGLRINLDNELMTVGSSEFRGGGATRVYSRDGNGSWEFRTMFEAPEEDQGGHFGAWSAIDAKTKDLFVSSGIVGMIQTIGNGDRITAFHYQKESDSWERGEIMRAPSPSSIGFFGVEPIIVGDFLYTGYPGDATGGVDGAGSIVCYRRDADASVGWSFEGVATLPLPKPAIAGFGGRIDATTNRIAGLSLIPDDEGSRNTVVSIAERQANGDWRFLAEIDGSIRDENWPGRLVFGGHFFALCSAFEASEDGLKNAGAVFVFPNSLFEKPVSGND